MCGVQIEAVELWESGETFSWWPVAVSGLERIWFDIDHIIPLSKKGTNAYVNLQTACVPCNQEKGSDIMEVSDQGTPIDFEYQLNSRVYDKELNIHYPDWKPYYGF